MSFPIIDIILVLLLVCFLLVGLFKGFWRSLFALLSSFVTLLLAILIAKPVASLLDGWFHISGALSNSFHGGIENYVDQHGYTNGWMAQVMRIVLGKDYQSLVVGGDTTNLVNTFSHELGYITLVFICVVVLYIAIRLLLLLLSKILKKITSKGVMKGLDRSLGAVFGTFKGIVVVFIAFGVAFELSTFITAIGDWINSMLIYNPISKFVYGLTKQIIENIIMPFITR